jgi:hypothetical protein
MDNNYKMQSIVSQDEYIINSIKHFYKNDKNLKNLEDILMQKTNISLRILDYFPNNFARERNIIINGVHIYSDYKNVLKGYTKRNFDPFCRGDCIKLNKSGMTHTFYKNNKNNKNQKVTDEYIITTIRQLNFFKWCIERDIIDYISKNLEDIQKNIAQSNKEFGKKSDKKFMMKTVQSKTISFT